MWGRASGSSNQRARRNDIAVTVGATLRLRIDDVVDESTVREDQSYGPVFIRSALTVDHWWNCVVTRFETIALSPNLGPTFLGTATSSGDLHPRTRPSR